MFSLRDVIDIAVRVEGNGERIYREAKENTSSPELASLLEWLADQEREHAEWFAHLATTIPEKQPDPELVAQGQGLLESVIGDECFSLDAVDFSLFADMDELLEAAIELEHDTVLFYQMLLAFVHDDKDLQSLQRIIDEETQHGQKLVELLEPDAE